MIIGFYSQVSLSSSLVFTKVSMASASVSLWLFTVSYRPAFFLLNFKFYLFVCILLFHFLIWKHHKPTGNLPNSRETIFMTSAWANSVGFTSLSILSLPNVCVYSQVCSF